MTALVASRAKKLEAASLAGLEYFHVSSKLENTLDFCFDAFS